MENTVEDFTPEEKQALRRFGEHANSRHPVSFTLPEHAHTPLFETFREKLADLLPGTSLRREGADDAGMPGISPARGLTLHALPRGGVLRVLLEKLGEADGLASAGDGKATLPDLTLYIARQCPYCPVTLGNLLPLALAGEIRLTVIDGILFPEAAEEDGVRSLPTVISSGGPRWTGVVTAAEVKAVLGGEELSLPAMERLVEEGEAPRLAEMMLAEKSIFPAFLDLLTHERMPLRLGAMVAMEALVEAAPALGAEAVPPLVDRYPEESESVKGDLLYLFGEAGGRAIRPWLEEVAEKEDSEEIRQMALEAVERIDERLEGGAVKD